MDIDSEVMVHSFVQGTVVEMRHFEIHQSTDLWEDLETFRPDRFQNAHGDRVEN